MAKFFGKQSNYLFNKDVKYYLYAAILALLPLAALYFIFRNSSSLMKSPWIYSGIMLVFIFIVKQVIEPLMDSHQKKSGRYFRGWTGELSIQQELRKLPDTYSVFPDIKLNKNTGNIDFVVVGPTGVFALEVKSHSGNINYRDGELVNNGRPFEKDFLRQAKGAALQIHDFLQDRLRAEIFVKPVLVFSGYAKMSIGLRPLNGVYVLQKQWLARLFENQTTYQYPLALEKLEEALKTV